MQSGMRQMIAHMPNDIPSQLLTLEPIGAPVSATSLTEKLSACEGAHCTQGCKYICQDLSQAMHMQL